MIERVNVYTVRCDEPGCEASIEIRARPGESAHSILWPRINQHGWAIDNGYGWEKGLRHRCPDHRRREPRNFTPAQCVAEATRILSSHTSLTAEEISDILFVRVARWSEPSKAAIRILRDHGMTLQEIGDAIGVTRERVRQLTARK